MIRRLFRRFVRWQRPTYYEAVMELKPLAYWRLADGSCAAWDRVLSSEEIKALGAVAYDEMGTNPGAYR